MIKPQHKVNKLIRRLKYLKETNPLTDKGKNRKEHEIKTIREKLNKLYGKLGDK